MSDEIRATSLGLIGAGGAGQALALTVSGERWIKYVEIFDPQEIASENLRNQVLCFPHLVQRPKALVTREFLLGSLPNIKEVRGFQREFGPDDKFCDIMVVAVHTKRARQEIAQYVTACPHQNSPLLCIDLCLPYRGTGRFSAEVMYHRDNPEYLETYLERLHYKSEAPQHETVQEVEERRSNRPECLGLAWVVVTMIRWFIEGKALPYFVDGDGLSTFQQ